MPDKTLSIVSALLTAVLIVLLSVVLFFGTLVMLNGFDDSSGGPALTASIVCQGIGVLLAAILAGALTRLFVNRFNWNKFLAVSLSVLSGLVLGGFISFLSFFISIAIADTIWNMR